ncbi:MAG: cation transporter [Clostridia bacterium]|nr:cation transporter [Clostridia bacterium]
MIHLLAKWLIDNYKDYQDPATRRGYGILCGVMGICLNLLQSVAKLIVGLLAGSVAIVADGVNNFSDAASSVITLWGFHNAGRRADEDHPFGHGRSEYVAGVVVAVLVMAIGVEILKESITKMIHPEPVTPGLLSFLVLGGSVLLKLYMWAYNRSYGKKLHSPTLGAVAVDSISDVFVTLVVIVAMAVSKFSSLNVDAYGGFLVGLFVLYMGAQSMRETISPLLGVKPETEFVEQVKEIVCRPEQILDAHNIIVHDYGHGVRFVSLDVEVPGDMDLFSIHDEVDFAEHLLRKELGCRAVIHYDPVMEETEELSEVRATLVGLLQEHFESFELKDIRIIPQEPKDKLVFEVYVPIDYAGAEQDLRKELKALVQTTMPQFSARVTVEHKYV